MDADPKPRLGAPEVAAGLRRRIAEGDLYQGERLPAQRTLADDLGVARGTVREALRQLSDEGLIEVRRSSGAYVAVSTDLQTNPIIENARPLELIDARFALEPHICRLAVLHARRSDLDKAERLLAIMEQSTDDPDRFAEADTMFHNLLAESTGNGLLIWVVAQISSVRNQREWARMRNLILDRETIELYNEQHRQILRAIENRLAEEAAAVMKLHLESARLALTRSAAT